MYDQKRRKLQRLVTLTALVPPALGMLCLVTTAEALADTLVIKRPGAHPAYSFDAEPHALVGFIDPPGPAFGTGFGVGFRGTIEIVDNGFIPKINNTVGIGFGLDWMRYDRGRCRFGPVPDCNGPDEVDYFVLPVVMQWNFFLSRNWSVFGEPGVQIRFTQNNLDDDVVLDPLTFYAGGRFHFADMMALTMRLGYPTFSVGVSFLL